MKNFVSVVHELERLWEAIGVNKSDIDRMDDIADVLGYSGRVVLTFDTMPSGNTLPNQYVDSVTEGDSVLIEYGPEQGIYKLIRESIGVDDFTYRLDDASKQDINDVDIVVLKRSEDDNILEHRILFYSKGKWYDRVIYDSDIGIPQ